MHYAAEAPQRMTATQARSAGPRDHGSARVGDVVAATSRLQDATAKLGQIIDRLADRLEPVCRPAEKESVESKNGLPDPGPQCPLANEIHDKAVRVDQFVARLAAVESRLEI